MLSQKELIIKYLEDKDWTPEYELSKRETDLGWIGSEAGRRVRELVSAGVLERRLNGRYAEVGSKGTIYQL